MGHGGATFDGVTRREVANGAPAGSNAVETHGGSVVGIELKDEGEGLAAAAVEGDVGHGEGAFAGGDGGDGFGTSMRFSIKPNGEGF